MTTEELKFEELLKEYVDVIESTDVKELKESNRIAETDINIKQKEIVDVGARIEQIQAELDSLNENPTVRLEYPETIKNKEDKLQEAKDFKEKKEKEILKLIKTIKENNKKIRKVNNIAKDVIKKAEEKTDKENEEIDKKIAELKEREAKYGIKIKDKEGRETIQLTKEEKVVVAGIKKEIRELRNQKAQNLIALKNFKDTIEEAKKSKEAFRALRDRVNTPKEEVKEEPTPVVEETKEPQSKNEKEVREEPTPDPKKEEPTPDPKKEEPTPDPKREEPTPDPKKEEPTPDPKREEPTPDPKREEPIPDPKREEPTPDPKREEPTPDPKREEPNKDNIGEKYKAELEKYKALMGMYYDAVYTLGDLQQQYENGEIEYSEYEKQALYVADRYKFMMDEYAKIKELYDEARIPDDKFAGVNNEDLENKLKELDEESNELWQQGVHENTPDAERYHEILEEIKRIKEELKQRKENTLRGMSLEELEAKRRELYAKIGEQQEPDEYGFRTHKENGLEGYEEDEIDKGLREIREEIERRKPKNIEAPEEPEDPGMLLEKPKTSVRRFEEIMAGIEASKNAMSDAELGRYDSAKGGWLLPVKYDKGDWLRNSARWIVNKFAFLYSAPRKIYSMIRTGKKQKEKMENITNNVNELSQEEFEVLVEGLQGYKGHRDKANAAVRRAVQERLARQVDQENAERNVKIAKALEYIRESHAESLEITERLKADTLSPEERKELEARKLELDTRGSEAVKEVEMLRQEGADAQGGSGVHGLEEESKASREGSNLSGRKFAKRSSNDEALEKKQAELSRAQREASERGDGFGEVDAFIRHEDLLRENTSTKKILGITVSRSERNHSELIATKEYREDDLAQNAIVIATVVATTVNMVKQIQNARALAEHNARLEQAEAANQQSIAQAERLRTEIINNEGVVEQGIQGTDQTRTAAAWGIGHEGAATPYNYTGGWGSQQLDKTFHQIMNGTVTDQTLKDFIANGTPAIKAYAAAHPQFDYTALLDSMDHLAAGGVDAITQYNTAVRGVVQLAKDMGEITSTSVGALSLSPTYIETMIPLVATGKAVTQREYERALKRVKRKERKEERKAFKESLKHRGSQGNNEEPVHEDDVKDKTNEGRTVEDDGCK